MKVNDMHTEAARHWTLIWHGCEISHISNTDQGELQLKLSVASVIAADGTQGYLKGVTLQWPHGHCQTDAPLPDVLGGVSDGHWVINNALQRSMSIPAAVSQPHTLVLRLISGTELCAQGHTCHITVAPDAQFQESMAC